MRHSAGTKLLFEQAKAHLNEILTLIEEYNEIAQDIEDLGFVSDQEVRWTPPYVELIGNGCTMVEDSDILDEFWRGGQKKKNAVQEISVKRLNMLNRRDRIGSSVNWICVYCRGVGDQTIGPDGRMWHIDHFYPVDRGGDNRDDNLVLACATCNLKKKAMLLADWFEIATEVRKQQLAAPEPT